MSMSKSALRAVTCCALLVTAVAHAQTEVTSADEYNKRLKIYQTISPGGDTPFGEQINLYTGELSFRQTDISFPGIGPTITITRSTGTSLEDHSTDPLAFGNWDIALPRIESMSGLTTKWRRNRCTTFGPPVMQFGWNGWSLVTPDGDRQPLLKRLIPAAPTMVENGQAIAFPGITNANWQIGCLNKTTKGEPLGQEGEAYLAVSPDGTKYYLTHLVYTAADTLRVTDEVFGEVEKIRRQLATMYVTKIVDRFDNTLTFEYDENDLKKLKRIVASDGRTVTFTWRPDVPDTITMDATDTAPRKWQYQYADITSTSARLSGVVLPDLSTWQFSANLPTTNSAFWSGHAELSECDTRDASQLPVGTPGSGTIVSPTGLTGTFEVTGTWHGRSYVPSACYQSHSSAPVAEGVPQIFGTYSLTKRTISGPGIPEQSWTYAYSPAVGSANRDACAVAGTCVDTAWVDAIDPELNRTRHTFSTRWGAGEGQSVKVETYQGASTLLRVDTYTYALPGQGTWPWPARVGESFDEITSNIAKQEVWAPLKARTITQQGVDFAWEVTAFDGFARPLTETRGTNPQKIDETTYHDNVGKWILGQVKEKKTKLGPGGTLETVSTTNYVNDLPYRTWKFGKLQQTIDYNANGTVATVSDGRDSGSYDTSVVFSDYKLGIPQRITFPDGKFKTAKVNELGLIVSVNDENNYKTCYAFDIMGRLAKIAYADEAANVCDEAGTRWNPLLRTFRKKTAGDSDYGLGPDHWVERVNTGNGYTVTHYDGLWRPSVVERFDFARKTETLSQVVTRYDGNGNVVYTSYPTDTVTSYTTTAPGTTTTYDALDRPLRVLQDSELGSPLETKTEYLTGFQTRATNARGIATTTQQYLTFDQPSTDLPLVIVQPEGLITRIGRDVHGKPLWLNRGNSDGSVSLTRTYGYNAAHELCKTVEPETGTTLMGYDPAGNLLWSAAGLPATVTCTDSSLASPIIERRSRRQYDQRNRLVELTHADGRNTTVYEYTPDSLPKTITTYNGPNFTQPIINAYSYNARRQLGGLGESVEQSGWYTWSFGYGYDKNGFLSTHVYPGSSVTVDYAPNALGQATKAGTFAIDAKYFPNGAIKAFKYGNGIVHSLEQNTRQLPDRSRDMDGATAVLDDSYTYDESGNVAAISDGITPFSGDRTMTYDGLDRLTSADSPMFNGKISYTYDVLDNLQTVTKPGRLPLRYCYDGSNRLAFIRENTPNCTSGPSIASLGWDAQGNVRWKNEQDFGFNFDNRLREVTGVEVYRYDAHGRRVMSYSAQGLGNIFSMYSLDGVVRQISNARAKQSVERAVTDANRNVVERNQYEPYGKLIGKTADDNPP